VEGSQPLEPWHRDGPLAPLIRAEDRGLELLLRRLFHRLQGETLLLPDRPETFANPFCIVLGYHVFIQGSTPLFLSRHYRPPQSVKWWTTLRGRRVRFEHPAPFRRCRGGARTTAPRRPPR